jgi:hypothetical protein
VARCPADESLCPPTRDNFVGDVANKPATHAYPELVQGG